MLKCALTVCLALAASAAHAASLLPQTFACGREGTAGGLGGGDDLTRYVVDNTRYPNAVCNDATPAVFYYGPASKVEDRNKWIIFLQGGGTCVDGQSCAQRWCSIDTNYGMDKMSSSLTKPRIRGGGFLNPGSQNRFGSWNRVLIFYCSSDGWIGRSSRTLQANVNGATRDYDAHFKGALIIDAVLDTLRNATSGGGKRRAVSHAESEWPDLDHAEAVLFAGTSAGGAGARANADRVGTKLRATNPALEFRVVVEAAYGTAFENNDFTRSTYCANDPARGCTWEAYTRAKGEAIDRGLYGAQAEESCAQWHAANEPGTEWQCADGEHVLLHHVTTHFFVRQDLQDPNIGEGFVGPNFGTPADFARRVEDELRSMPVPEEPRGGVPGAYAPQCMTHEAFSDNERVFQMKMAGVSYHDAVWNWWTGAQPQVVIRPFTGTAGAAPECP
ncbi:MAG TPA: pectin acetylesterase-family hydrolase [Thermoanaerobaculia bacterium]|jgi:hypothetical protein|nr:pectin acetylesterase-family hydrolase [Thermoanaerobaculia bacterium]